VPVDGGELAGARGIGYGREYIPNRWNKSADWVNVKGSI
jgi:hypothetical protein